MAKKKPKPMTCKLCGRNNNGPLESSQDGIGWIHAYGCNNVNTFTFHKGEACRWRPDTFCQENNCQACEIYLDKTEGIK